MNNNHLKDTCLKNLTSAELMELATRKKKIEQERPIELPMEQVDLTALRAALHSYISGISTGQRDDDDAHYVFEAALTAFYGKGIWEWVREQEW